MVLGPVKRGVGLVTQKFLSWTGVIDRQTTNLGKLSLEVLDTTRFDHEQREKASIDEAIQFDPFGAGHQTIPLSQTKWTALDERTYVTPISGMARFRNYFQREIIDLYFDGNLEAVRTFYGYREYGDDGTPLPLSPEIQEILSSLTKEERFVIRSLTADLRQYIEFFLALTRRDDVHARPIVYERPAFQPAQPIPITGPPPRQQAREESGS